MGTEALIATTDSQHVTEARAGDPRLHPARRRQAPIARRIAVLWGAGADAGSGSPARPGSASAAVRVHRFMGATYVASATALSGPILAPTAYTGLVASAGFTVLDLAMLFMTWTAVRMITAGRYGEHRRWMIRSFSLIMAGVMLRVWTPIYDGLAAVGIVDFPSRRRTPRLPGWDGSRTCCLRSGSPAALRKLQTGHEPAQLRRFSYVGEEELGLRGVSGVGGAYNRTSSISMANPASVPTCLRWSRGHPETRNGALRNGTTMSSKSASTIPTASHPPGVITSCKPVSTSTMRFAGQHEQREERHHSVETILGRGGVDDVTLPNLASGTLPGQASLTKCGRR